MASTVFLIAKREVQMRIRSAMFMGMFLSFVILVAFAPWIISIENTSNATTVGSIDPTEISILFIVYGILISSCVLLSYGLIEEKASAVIDLLVSSVKPENILKGKIFGITSLTFVEMTILSVVGFVSSSLRADQDLSISPQFLLLMILFLAPAIAITTFSVASISFRVRKIEEMGILQMPLLIILAGCLFAGVFSIFSPASRVGEVGQWIPVVSSFVSPVLFQNHEMSEVTLILSFLSASLASIAIAKLSSKSFLRQAIK